MNWTSFYPASTLIKSICYLLPLTGRYTPSAANQTLSGRLSRTPQTCKSTKPTLCSRREAKIQKGCWHKSLQNNLHFPFWVKNKCSFFKLGSSCITTLSGENGTTTPKFSCYLLLPSSYSSVLLAMTMQETTSINMLKSYSLVLPPCFPTTLNFKPEEKSGKRWISI